MQIFQREIDDGLAHSISASASILYASVAEPCGIKDIKIQALKSNASISDADLYYVQSILVSSNWNKNDDIFDKTEVWLAKNTPEDKPTNLEHDENIIIGHITSNWPITEDGKILADDTSVDNLPDKFHILTGSVIYRAFSNTDLKDRADQLIAQIEDGTKYVSMECFFKGFDYGIINKTNSTYRILARNDDTAYLTKYLKAYGGIGEHEDYKIGRVLRNITFTGKGFVNKPANADSIIFTKNVFDDGKTTKDTLAETEKKAKKLILGVFHLQSNIQSENIIMSSENIIKEEISVAEAPQVASENIVQIEELNKQIAELQTSKEKLEAEFAQMIKATEEQILSLTEDASNKATEIEAIKAEMISANEVIAGYKTKEELMMKQDKKNKRAASLVDQGVDSETASSIADRFESMEDDTFAAVTSLIAGKMPPWLEKIKKDDKDTKEDKTDKKKASETVVDDSILENVEVEPEVNLSLSSDGESEVNSTRAALVDFVCSRLGKKNK